MQNLKFKIKNWLTKPKIKTKQRITLSLIVALAALVLSLVLTATARATFTRYFRAAAASEPMPNVYQTADAPTGTVEQRVMTLAMGDAATASSHSEPGNTSGMKMGVIFVSDPLVAENVSAGDWTVHAHALESHPLLDAYLKFYIYRWTSADGFGNAIAGPSGHPTELATTDAAYELTMSGNAVNFADNDKLVVEVYFNVTGSKSGQTVTMYWGMTTPEPPTATDDDGWISGPGSNIPTLGWPLLLIAISFFIFFMIKKGKLSPSLKPVTLLLVLALMLSSSFTLPAKNLILRPLRQSQSVPAVSITDPDGKRYELKPVALDSTRSLPAEVNSGGAKR